MKNVPCRYCEKRSLGCHGRCEEYMEYKREREVLRARNHVTDDNEIALNIRLRDRVDKIRRRSR